MIDYKALASQHGLGWDVKKAPLTIFEDGKIIETPYVAVMREDTEDVFQSVKDSYSSFQNHELFALADAIACEVNLPIKKAMAIDGGRKVIVQLESLAIRNIGKNKDTIQNYVTVLNSHDGSSSLRWGTSRFTISCKNQFHALTRELKNHTRHTKNMRLRVDESVREIRKVISYQERLNEVTYELSELNIGKDDVYEFINRLIDVDLTMDVEKLQHEYHGRRLNRAHALEDAILAQCHEKGMNAWGLWEGVTYYTTHHARSQSEYSKINGALSVLDNRALDLALSLN
jgi:phage/plasmid-like protein (TIGR03299 family)